MCVCAVVVVMCRSHPNLVAVGMADGVVAIYDTLRYTPALRYSLIHTHIGVDVDIFTAQIPSNTSMRHRESRQADVCVLCVCYVWIREEDFDTPLLESSGLPDSSYDPIWQVRTRFPR